MSGPEVLEERGAGVIVQAIHISHGTWGDAATGISGAQVSGFFSWRVLNGDVSMHLNSAELDELRTVVGHIEQRMIAELESGK